MYDFQKNNLLISEKSVPHGQEPDHGQTYARMCVDNTPPLRMAPDRQLVAWQPVVRIFGRPKYPLTRTEGRSEDLRRIAARGIFDDVLLKKRRGGCGVWGQIYKRLFKHCGGEPEPGLQDLRLTMRSSRGRRQDKERPKTLRAAP